MSTNITFKENQFEIANANGSIFIPYILPINKIYSQEAFSLCLLKGAGVVENDIYRVYVSEKSAIVGWIFPVQALVSMEHDYAHDEYFLSCAYSAFQMLIQKRIEKIESKINSINQVSLLDIYEEEDDVVLIISNEEVSEIEDFSIDYYFPHMFRYGYSKGKSNYIINNYRENIQKNLKLNSISSSLRNNSFLVELFKSAISSEEDEVVSFLLLYQVIEILIFEVFRNDLYKCYEKYKNINHSDYDEMWESAKSLSEIKAEKGRIKKLFSNKYTELEISIVNNFKEISNELLILLGKKAEDSAALALYKVRNAIVHEYRYFLENQKNKLKALIPEFINLIIEILVKYRIPSEAIKQPNIKGVKNV